MILRAPGIGAWPAALLALLVCGTASCPAQASEHLSAVTAPIGTYAIFSYGSTLIRKRTAAAQTPLLAQRLNAADSTQPPVPLRPGAAQPLIASLATPAISADSTTPAPLAAPHATGSPPANGAAIGPAEDIRDIRGLKFVLPAWLVPAVLAGLVLLALLLYGLWRWYRRRRRPRILLPYELALQRLEDIRGLMQPAQAREFSIAVSDIVRSYIEQRFEVTATHRTTEEFLHDLLQSGHPALARHRGLLADFLEQCDLAKFAGLSLTVQNIESLHASARTFVLETAKPDPPASAEPSASANHAPPAPPRRGSSEPAAEQPLPHRTASKNAP